MFILSVLGFLYLDSAAIIKSNGGKGGNDGTAQGYGGGGSGGVSVNILYGALVNNGTVQANGGARSTGTVYGGAGGAGSVRLNSLRAA